VALGQDLKAEQENSEALQLEKEELEARLDAVETDPEAHQDKVGRRGRDEVETDLLAEIQELKGKNSALRQQVLEKGTDTDLLLKTQDWTLTGRHRIEAVQLTSMAARALNTRLTAVPEWEAAEEDTSKNSAKKSHHERMLLSYPSWKQRLYRWARGIVDRFDLHADDLAEAIVNSSSKLASELEKIFPCSLDNIISYLDQQYGRSSRRLARDIVLELIGVERRPGESIRDYVKLKRELTTNLELLGQEVPTQIIADAVVAHARLPLTEATMLESEIENITTAERAFQRLTDMRAVQTDVPELLENQLKGEENLRKFTAAKKVDSAPASPRGILNVNKKAKPSAGESQQEFTKRMNKDAPAGQYWNFRVGKYLKSKPDCPQGGDCQEFRKGGCSDKFHRIGDPEKRKAINAERSKNIAKQAADKAANPANSG
jgi:hypothetical protein